MADSAYPQVGIPQPAAGIPGGTPSPQPQADENPFAGLGPAPKAATPQPQKPQSGAPQPSGTPSPSGQDDDNPFATLQKPQSTMDKVVQGVKDFVNKPSPEGSVEDIAKVHMATNLQDQQAILEKLHPGKSMVQGDQLMVRNAAGKYVPFDGTSLNVIKDLAQLSGTGIETSAQVATTMGLTALGGVAGSVVPGAGTAAGAGAGYVASLPLGTYLGEQGRSYLMKQWTGVQPDEARMASDMKSAIAFNTIFGLAIPLGGKAVSYGVGQLKNMATARAAANDSIRKGVQDLIESSTGRSLDAADFPSKDEIGTTVKHFYDDQLEKFGAKINTLRNKAISDSNDAVEPVKNIKSKILDFLQGGADGAYVTKEGGYLEKPKNVPAYMTSDAERMSSQLNPELTSPINDNPVSSVDPSKAASPFGSARLGNKATDELVDTYNALHKADLEKGGLPFSQFDRQVQRLQDMASFNDKLFDEPQINRMFKDLQNTASEQRTTSMAARISDPEMKSYANQAYQDFATAKGPANQLDALWNQSKGTPELFADALVRPDSSNALKGLSYITSHNPTIMNDVKASFLNKSFNNSMDEVGKFDAGKFMSSIKDIGQENQKTLFSSEEMNGMKYYANMFARIDQADPSSGGVMRRLGKAIVQLNPLTQESQQQKLAIDAMSSIKNVIQNNRPLAEEIAEKGFGSEIGDMTVKDKMALQKWTRELRNQLAAKQGVVSVTGAAQKQQIQDQGGTLPYLGRGAAKGIRATVNAVGLTPARPDSQ